MRYLLMGFCFVLIVLANSEIFADQVYTWTDKDGNMHITAEPPPQNARVKDVLMYEPRPEKNVPNIERGPDSKAEPAVAKPESEEVRQARASAETARKAAEIAAAKAEEATKAAERYIETHNRNEYMRRAYQYQMRKAAEDAKAAQERARIAEEKAVEAEKKAIRVEERARELDD